MTIKTINEPIPHSEKYSRWLQVILILMCLSSLTATVVLAYQHQVYKDGIYESSKTYLKQLTIDGALNIDAILQQAMISAEALADGLTNGKVNPTNMHVKLKKMLASNDNYYGGSITFAPYAYKSKTKLYSAYYSKSGADGDLTFQQLADIYDYTSPEYDWYVEPMAKSNRWDEPYWDEAGKTYMITYSALFYGEYPDTKEKGPKGVVTIDISLSRIKDIIESLNIGPSGFGALTTRDGNYLYHPNYEYVQAHRNLRDVASEKNDKGRLRIADMASRGEGGIIDHISTTTGQASWLIFETVPTSGWSLQNTYIKEDLDISVDILRQQIIWIIITTIVFLVLLTSLILRVNFGCPGRVWLLTAIVSALLITGISIIWSLALTYHDPDKTTGVKILDKAVLGSLMHNYRQISEKKYLPAPVFVATGLYIDTIEFSNANDVVVTGRVWQKYPKSYPTDLVKGVQLGHAKNVKFTKTATRIENGSEVAQWSFQADLQVQLDYSRYPLEVDQLTMQLLPLDTDQHIVLVPDLDAYRLTTATLLPGLDREVFIPGWKLTESFFLFRTMQKNTNFGIEQNFDQQTLPTLHFVIGVKRVFIDAFISNLTPLIIVAIILFSIVLLSSEVGIEKLLSVCVAVFFVVVFSHLDIRKDFSSGEIFYLEYFYFVIYFIIILAPMNSFRIALSMRSRFFEYQEGLLSKVSYWPTILGVFFIITVFKFY